MNDEGIHTLTLDSFKEKCNSLSVNDIQSYINQMSHEQITVLIQSIGEENTPSGFEKLIAAVSAINDHLHLETIGKVINKNQFIHLLEQKKEIDCESLRKIPPLLVGMPHSTFVEVLLHIPEDLLQNLHEESGTEPLQHQLTLVNHDLTQDIEDFSVKAYNLESDINEISPEHITHQIIDSIHHEINELKLHIHQNLALIQTALSIAWNSSRTDLIDVLSFQKESWQRYDIRLIGHPREYNTSATGIYAKLEDRLNSIFSNNEDPRDIEALHDTEPAIEALVKFSIWYLHDYWEMGLLPNIHNVSELDLPPLTHSNRERADYRASLFSEAQSNLENSGLKTVKDLKDNKIYNREMLQEYLDEHPLGM